MLIDRNADNDLAARITRIGGNGQITHQSATAKALVELVVSNGIKTAAIAFYLSQGFSLMGFNACEYSNQDIEKHEVRIEMGCLL